MGCWKGPRTKNECQQPPLRVAGVFLRQYGVFCVNEAVLPHLVKWPHGSHHTGKQEEGFVGRPPPARLGKSSPSSPFVLT